MKSGIKCAANVKMLSVGQESLFEKKISTYKALIILFCLYLNNTCLHFVLFCLGKLNDSNYDEGMHTPF